MPSKKFVIRFDRRDVTIALRPDGADVQLKDGFFRVTPGGPALPGRMVEIALPPGQRATRVTAKVLTVETLLNGPVFVRPQESPGVSGLKRPKRTPVRARRRDLRVDSSAAPRRRPMAPNAALYEAALDKPVAALRGTNIMGGVPVVSIYVRPIRLDQAANLELVTAVEVSILSVSDRRRSVRGAVRGTLRTSQRAIRFQDVAASLVLNPEDVAVPRSRRAGKSGTGGASGGMPPGAGQGGSLPGLAPIPTNHFAVGPKHVDYLIITDNHTWDPITFTPGPSLGNLVGAFQPLLNHKKKRGLRTHLATVTDIVNNIYGDHRTGARDLQECLRRFIQAYVYSRGVEWLLIGGDVDIVPIRYACGSVADGLFGPATGEPASPPKGKPAGKNVPKGGEFIWKDTFLALRLNDKVATEPSQFGQPDHILTMLASGTVVPKVAAPSGNDLCWFYTDDTWTTPSAAITPFVRVNGPAETINDEPQWYSNDNLIPTDMYYASLYGPDDLKSGVHDWDHQGTGLYAQWSRDQNLGGADYTPDISVGRAPVGDAVEVKTFVDKVISYETADTRPAEYDRFTRMLFVAEHWDHGVVSVARHATDAVVPPEGSYSYSHDPANSRSVVGAGGLKEGAFPQLLAYPAGGGSVWIPYDDTGAARGWHYAKSDTDLSPSVFEVSLPFGGVIGFPVPVRTAFVVVRSPDVNELTPTSYFFDPNDLDGSIVDTEKIRAYMQSAHPRVSQIHRIYSDEADLGLSTFASPVEHFTQAAVTAAMDTGPHLVALSGHGNWPGCCGVHVGMAPGLSNGSRTSIVYADSCLTAQVDEEDSLGEVILAKSTLGGAVAYVGYTRYGWIGVGTLLQQDFFKQLATQRHFGLMVDAGRRMWTHGEMGRWHALATMALGCPEMQLFRDDQDAEPSFIANDNTKELHERFCPWIRLMSVRHQRYFGDKATALAAGYDGCGFCLREHHHW